MTLGLTPILCLLPGSSGIATLILHDGPMLITHHSTNIVVWLLTNAPLFTLI